QLRIIHILVGRKLLKQSLECLSRTSINFLSGFPGIHDGLDLKSGHGVIQQRVCPAVFYQPGIKAFARGPYDNVSNEAAVRVYGIIGMIDSTDESRMQKRVSTRRHEPLQIIVHSIGGAGAVGLAKFILEFSLLGGMPCRNHRVVKFRSIDTLEANFDFTLR